MEAIFPIWKRDTRELAQTFMDLGFRARAVCVDPRILDRSFAGRDLDRSFFSDLPANADPCGENGEFHSFVYDGPIFREPVKCRAGEVVERNSFVFCDLLAEEEVPA
jgi:diphthamide synthase (EF-2-diphthine--ammonia ligase)